jgi:hypothetical protein
MPILPLNYYSDEPVHVPLKVSLFTRIHEMKQLVAQLKPVAQSSSAKKGMWLNENEFLLQATLETFIQQPSLHLEDPSTDPEMVKLLVEYTTTLQELMSVAQSVFHVSEKEMKKRAHLRAPKGK